MTDRVLDIDVVEPGSVSDPFAPTSDESVATTSRAGVDAVSSQESAEGASVSQSATSPDTQAGVAGESDDLTDEEIAALEIYFRERVNDEVLPKVSSSYDKQITAIQRQLELVRGESQQREQALREELREAKLNGLSDEDKARLQAQWEFEDERRKLDEYRKTLDDYGNAVSINQYIAQYPHLELTPEDFAEFNSPEEMAYFVTIAEAEYWKAVASKGGLAAFQQVESAPAKATAQAVAADAVENVPAGASAPTNAEGGGSPPNPNRFNTGQSRQAMIDNISSGWEIARITQV